MDNKTIITAALTAFFGITVFVVGQLIQKLFLEPIQEQKKIVGEIAYTLVLYANVSDVSRHRRENIGLLEIEDPIAVAANIRKLAGRLRSTLYTIPFYRTLSVFKLVASRAAIVNSSQSLVGWSNSIFDGDVQVHRTSIIEALKLRDIS